MLNTINARAAYVGDTVFNMPRQMWLASLGAAVVTREWAEREGRPMFRNLIKQGTQIESRAVRMVGDRVESVFDTANTAWRRTRSTLTHTVKQYADGAVALVRELPYSLPRVEMPVVEVQVKTARRGRKTVKARATHAVKARTTRTVKKAKRVVRSAKRA